jgi:hypothetical protein
MNINISIVFREENAVCTGRIEGRLRKTALCSNPKRIKNYLLSSYTHQKMRMQNRKGKISCR